MSRSRAALFFLAVTAHHAARAQDAAGDAIDARVRAMIEQQKEAYGVPSRKPRCAPGAPGEIVVCARDDSRFRAAPTSEVDPNSAQALADGVPRAPDFSKGCHGGETGCVSFGWAPPPMYIIDLDAIPEPAPGSDADRIARGEMAAP